MRAGAAMGIQGQARSAGTPLSGFLTTWLPQLDDVVQAWAGRLATSGDTVAEAAAPSPAVREAVGWALELCVDLDLPDRPPRMRELSYLPADRLTALLSAAGFEHRPFWVLPPGAVEDPELRHWQRGTRPTNPEQVREPLLAACLDLAHFRQPLHHLTYLQTAEKRRSAFASMYHPESSLGRSAEHLDALADCWDTYRRHGRQALLDLGERVTVAPELANGYGVADLVIGRTLIDIKLAVDPTPEDVLAWVRQLLGYVLLDRHDTFDLDTIAVYCAWPATLLTYPLPALLNAPHPTAAPPSLASLRTEFTRALASELDGYLAWKQHQQRNRPSH